MTLLAPPVLKFVISLLHSLKAARQGSGMIIERAAY